MTTRSREKQLRRKLRNNFPFYARKALQVRTKSGKMAKLKLNTAQQHLHDRIEEQIADTKMARTLDLKGRQQGISTYHEARAYWKTSHNRGYITQILTHEAKATQNLFEMAKRYHDNCPAIIRPVLGKSNAIELKFPRLDSGYRVATAGAKGTGRSSTAQYFHGSEVAFWPHADEHAAGILQAIPEEPGTEIHFESTANGIGNYFHRAWKLAEQGKSEFIPVFIPWFWQTEYQREVPVGFALSAEDKEYRDAYGLTLKQMAWRANKIGQFNGNEAYFNQEYPATPSMAFQTSTEDVLIRPNIVRRAREMGARLQSVGPKVLGVDPSRFGKDRFSISYRQGRVHKWTKSREKVGQTTQAGTMAGAGWVKRFIDAIHPDAVFVDVIGLGAGVVDRLCEMGYADIIIAVNSAENALNDDQYANLRAEMWVNTLRWLEDAPCKLNCSDAMEAELCAVKYDFDSKGRYLLEKKSETKKVLGASPDEADSLVMTFARPVTIQNRNQTNNYQSADSVAGY